MSKYDKLVDGVTQLGESLGGIASRLDALETRRADANITYTASHLRNAESKLAQLKSDLAQAKRNKASTALIEKTEKEVKYAQEQVDRIKSQGIGK